MLCVGVCGCGWGGKVFSSRCLRCFVFEVTNGSIDFLEGLLQQEDINVNVQDINVNPSRILESRMNQTPMVFSGKRMLEQTGPHQISKKSDESRPRVRYEKLLFAIAAFIFFWTEHSLALLAKNLPGRTRLNTANDTDSCHF